MLSSLSVAIDATSEAQGTAQASVAEGLEIGLERLRRQNGRISGDAVVEASQGGQRLGEEVGLRAAAILARRHVSETAPLPTPQTRIAYRTIRGEPGWGAHIS